MATRDDIKKRLRDRITELRNLAAFWDGRDDVSARIARVGYNARALECERILTWFNE